MVAEKPIITHNEQYFGVEEPNMVSWWKKIAYIGCLKGQ